MKHGITKKEKAIIRSIRTVPLQHPAPPYDPYGTTMSAEVEYPKVNVVRTVDRFSGDEDIEFAPTK